jgi:hypothetical protein
MQNINPAYLTLHVAHLLGVKDSSRFLLPGMNSVQPAIEPVVEEVPNEQVLS